LNILTGGSPAAVSQTWDLNESHAFGFARFEITNPDILTALEAGQPFDPSVGLQIVANAGGQTAFYNDTLAIHWVALMLPEEPSGDIGINADTAEIAVAGSVSGTSTTVFQETSNILVEGYGTSIITPGNPTIGATRTFLDVDGHDVTVEVEAGASVPAFVSNITVSGKPAVLPVEPNFAFVVAGDTALTAHDAETLDSFDLGGILASNVKYMIFKIANLSDVKSHFDISVVSVNPGLTELVTFSLDKVNYSPTLTIGNVGGNAVTDPVWARLDSRVLDENGEYLIQGLGRGTFLINVEQSNA
jgi:hypothetical protein